MISSNSFYCERDYVQKGNHCYKSESQLVASSDLKNVFYVENGQVLTYKPGIDKNQVWSPPPSANQYLGIISSSPQIIHQIQVQGSREGWVKEFIIQFRNNREGPLICWNSCLRVKGNENGFEVRKIELDYPIIADELRIYPLSWENSLRLRLDCQIDWTPQYHHIIK